MGIFKPPINLTRRNAIMIYCMDTVLRDSEGRQAVQLYLQYVLKTMAL